MSDRLLDLVTPLQGTDSQEDFSRGNTLPLLCTPFPMTAWTLQTGDGRWAFRWHDAKIQGLRATHQPSPWMGDWGHFTIMPQRGERLLTPFKRASGYDKTTLVMRPDYLRVHLLRDACVFEATPAERGARLRMTFAEPGPARLIVDCFSQGGSLDFDAENQLLEGSSRANYGGVPENFAQRFALRLNVPVSEFHQVEQDGKLLGALEITVPENGVVECEVATSYISDAQARLNLERQADSFEGMREKAAQLWTDRLGKVQIETDNEAQARTFYSCFYRTLTFPHKMHEVDAEGATVHYSPYDGAVHPGELWAGHGFWDTYRTAYPFYALLFPDEYASFLRGWINACREGGWYPRWPSPGYQNCMLSTHVDAVFADAMVKGIGGFDRTEAYAGLRRHALENVQTDIGYGRPGLDAYLSLGYIPADFRHSVAATLDNAYCDFCLAQIAHLLGEKTDAELFRERALSYRHLFDPAVDFMRAKNRDGSWLEPFEEFGWGGPYVEGGPWQTSWGVPHDVPGLIALYGGPEKFVAKLERMLATPPHFTVGDYGFEIHEMTEMACAAFGQYAHSNQPVHHTLYLFAAAGAPEKTDQWVRKILTEAYAPTPGGFAGDEDNGEMSAWYILSALGVFPLCPGRPEYTLTRPLFRSASVSLPNGSTLEITGSDPAEGEFTWNGRPLEGRTLPHDEIAGGGNLAFVAKSTAKKSEPPAVPAVDSSAYAVK